MSNIAAHRDVVEALASIATHHREIEHHRSEAELLLKSIEPKLVGRRYFVDRLGRLKGDYEITSVKIAYDAEVNVHGRKDRAARVCKPQIATYEMVANIIDTATDSIVKGDDIETNATVLHNIAACIRETGARLRKITGENR